MTTGDLDGDGRPEVIVASQGTDIVSVFHVPDADGPLSAPVSVAAGTGAQGLAVADLVGDPSPDVAVVNGDGVAALPGDGAGGLGIPNSSSRPRP